MSQTFFGRDEVVEGLSGMKAGDVVLDLAPQGEQLERLKQAGFTAIFGGEEKISLQGCVEKTGSDRELPYIVLWGSLFYYVRDSEQDEARMFGPDTVAFMTIEPAETYIPEASSRTFLYGEQLTSGEGVTITMHTFYNPLMEPLEAATVGGETDRGEPYFNHAAAFLL